MINDVTDTALWIATYRAEENLRKDALFRDPYASLLLDERAMMLAKFTQGSRYTAWSVIIRTRIIDDFILKLLSEKIDTVINLGAGLDTRPYRLELPPHLRWIEVDFPNIIDLKNDRLKNNISVCKLEGYSLDLSVEEKRNAFLKKISNESENVLILTEGVIPYLSNQEAESLARAIYQNENFKFWITEYYSPEILAYLRTPKRLKQMQNSPFLFYPKDWFAFFRDMGFIEIETKYFGQESKRLKRTPPTPGWAKQSAHHAIDLFLGYSLYKRSLKLS